MNPSSLVPATLENEIPALGEVPEALSDRLRSTFLKSMKRVKRSSPMPN
jgi:hypothetical protein